MTAEVLLNIFIVSFKITFNMLVFSGKRADKATLDTSRNHVPHYNLSIIAAGGEERRGTLRHTKDVLLMAIFLREDKV